jgi:hypothetical protein
MADQSDGLVEDVNINVKLKISALLVAMVVRRHRRA